MELQLRKWETEDAARVAKFANNSKIAENLRDAFPHPYTLQDAQVYIDGCMKNEGKIQMARAIVVDGMAVGSIGVFVGTDVYCKSAELGYWLAQPYWGQGIVTRAIMQICTEAFQNLDIVRIFAEPFAHNIGSRRALEKAGFALEGTMKKSVFKLGKYYDSCMYAKCKPESIEV